MKAIFDGIVKILLILLFKTFIYEFHVFIMEYKNHDRYYIITDSTSYTLFDKCTEDINRIRSGQ